MIGPGGNHARMPFPLPFGPNPAMKSLFYFFRYHRVQRRWLTAFRAKRVSGRS